MRSADRRLSASSMGAAGAGPDLAASALVAAVRHASWLEHYGPTSWDPYDVWARPLARRAKALYYRSPGLGLPMVAPFVLLDALIPRSRSLMWHRQRFATSDAHYAMAFCLLAHLDGRKGRSRALPFLEALVEERCPGEEDYCWGYPFDWETCFGTWPAGTPLITCTPYGYEAFEAAFELTGAQECLAIMESVGRFAFTRIGGIEVAPGVKASTYSPLDRRRVVNASAYRGYLLVTAGTRFGHDDWVEEGRATIAYVVRSQQGDGSWLYALDGKDAFIDNFHTCFVLKSLEKVRRVLGDDALVPVIARGYAFYKSHLLDEAGLPLPFARAQRMTLQRRDLYDYAEGINLALLLAQADDEAPSIADTLVEDLLTHWILPDGHFVTRQTVLGRNTVPYHRWAQAQAFRALVAYAAERRRGAGRGSTRSRSRMMVDGQVGREVVQDRRVSLLGCGIDALSFDETVVDIDRIVRARRPVQHCAVNAGKVVMMHKQSRLMAIVCSCALVNADGQSVVWASRVLGRPLPERVAGIDLFQALLALAADRGYAVYFLGATQEVLDASVSRACLEHPTLRVCGARDGYWAEGDGNVVEGIRKARPDILFVALPSPRKEYWLAEHLDRLQVPFAMGVGGSFDVYAGHVRRAPRWMQRAGLEWAFRFYQEPSRMWKRYLLGNLEFLLLVLKYRCARGSVLDASGADQSNRSDAQ